MPACPECGFTYGATPRRELAAALHAAAATYAGPLAADDPALRTCPASEQWSPLEYACHVRDIVLIQRDRVYVALVEDGPSFTSMYGNERVAFDRYDIQTPSVVADQIAMGADLLSRAFDGLDGAQWGRPLIYGFPAPARRDVEWVAHHTLHEMVHHRFDIARIQGAT